MTASSRSGSSVFLSTNTVIGTPQARCREITQSGRSSIMPLRRRWPEAGTKRVSSMAFKALSRSPVVSMEMNHCGVLRKINGCLERQLCG